MKGWCWGGPGGLGFGLGGWCWVGFRGVWWEGGSGMDWTETRHTRGPGHPDERLPPALVRHPNWRRARRQLKGGYQRPVPVAANGRPVTAGPHAEQRTRHSGVPVGAHRDRSPPVSSTTSLRTAVPDTAPVLLADAREHAVRRAPDAAATGRRLERAFVDFHLGGRKVRRFG